MKLSKRYGSVSEDLKFVLSHILWSEVKRFNVRASSLTHLDMAITKLYELLDKDVIISDYDCRQRLIDAISNIEALK
jgi:hypothetical protein